MTNEEIKDLMHFFDDSNITKVKIKNGEFAIELQKNLKCDTPIATSTVEVSEKVDMPKSIPTSELITQSINSPMVGNFYISPSPDTKAFVKVGASVKKGEVVGIIEAMKIMNEFEAEFDCKIIEILVEDGQPVEHGMPIFKVEKT